MFYKPRLLFMNEKTKKKELLVDREKEGSGSPGIEPPNSRGASESIDYGVRSVPFGHRALDPTAKL